MKVMHEKDMEKFTAEGIKGFVDVIDAVNEDSIVAGVRVIHAGSTVPKKVHSHKHRQMCYVISGDCEVFIEDENDKTVLKPGDFLLFEPYEQHYFTAVNGPVTIFEVRYD